MILWVGITGVWGQVQAKKPTTSNANSPSVYTDESLIPRILSDKDINRYQLIFELTYQGQFKQANKLIKQLDNSILIGHVEFERYMHPSAYRSRYSELAGWMKKYADHPNARRIYNLARKRRGKARAPRAPIKTNYPGVTGQAAPEKPPVPRRTRLERLSVSRFLRDVRTYVRKGQPERAEKRYWALEVRDLLTRHERTEALERIAASYYYQGNNFKARMLATKGATLSRTTVASADWIAGLAYWRESNYAQAYIHFNHVATSNSSSEWLIAAGHFWAARTAYYIGNAKLGVQHTLAASSYSESFYGLIAGKQLGLHANIDWTPPVLDRGAVANLMRYKATERAIALTEIGRDEVADEELRLLWGREGTAVQADLLAFASAIKLPAIQVRLSRAGGTAKAAKASNRYPLPDWEPVDGLRIDRALLFAMIRQESTFRSRAKSSVGARGLMQVMPATASYMKRDRSLFRRNRNRLFEPEFNLALGQQYVEYLFDQDDVEGNLFMLLAAYNGGPGSLQNWHADIEYQADPLLFIESISFFQTRHYIERVMANLWLYRMRLGQKTPSLDAVASGAWPMFEMLDTPSERMVAERRKARLNSRGEMKRSDE